MNETLGTSSGIVPAPIARQPWEMLIPVLLLTLFGGMVLYSAGGGSMEPFATSHFIRFAVFMVMTAIIAAMPREAVRVQPGNRVEITQWGGPAPLIGVVKRVEPVGRLKISALGIEEQRVNVIIGFEPQSLPAAARLGHGYQVDATILHWRAADVLRLVLREGMAPVVLGAGAVSLDGRVKDAASPHPTHPYRGAACLPTTTACRQRGLLGPSAQ